MGLISLGLLAVLFGYKYFTGYYEVELAGTYDNCTVEVKTSSTRKGTLYYVKVTCTEPEIVFNSIVDRSYYNGFKKYNSDHITFYRAKAEHNFARRISAFRKDGWEWYPTYKIGCDEREAEREYRGISPPNEWYLAYICLFIIAVLSIVFAVNSTDSTDIVLFGKSKDEY